MVEWALLAPVVDEIWVGVTQQMAPASSGMEIFESQDAGVVVMQSEADCVGESHQRQRFRGAVIVEQQQRISPTSALANLHSVKVEWSVGNTRPPNHESVCLGVVVSESEVADFG